MMEARDGKVRDEKGNIGNCHKDFGMKSLGDWNTNSWWYPTLHDRKSRLALI